MAGNPGSGLDELAMDDDEDVEMNVPGRWQNRLFRGPRDIRQELGGSAWFAANFGVYRSESRWLEV